MFDYIQIIVQPPERKFSICPFAPQLLTSVRKKTWTFARITYRLSHSQLKHLVCMFGWMGFFFATFDGKFIIEFSFLEQKVDRVLGDGCGNVLSSSFSYDPFEERKNTLTHSKTLCNRIPFVNSTQKGSLVGVEMLCWTVYYQLKQSNQRTKNCG